ncbi:hypothetical protein QTN25_006947 [Entamoeba marina]
MNSFGDNPLARTACNQLVCQNQIELGNGSIDNIQQQEILEKYNRKRIMHSNDDLIKYKAFKGDLYESYKMDWYKMKMGIKIPQLRYLLNKYIKTLQRWVNFGGLNILFDSYEMDIRGLVDFCYNQSHLMMLISIGNDVLVGTYTSKKITSPHEFTNDENHFGFVINKKEIKRYKIIKEQYNRNEEIKKGSHNYWNGIEITSRNEMNIEHFKQNYNITNTLFNQPAYVQIEAVLLLQWFDLD